MAKGAVIYDAMWRTKPFRALSRSAQCLYVQLCSDRDTDCAGLLTLNLAVLAKACDELDEAAIVDDLTELEEARWVFVDYDTDELFVKPRMRDLHAARSPKVLVSVLNAALSVQSEKLRVEVAAELRCLRNVSADEVAEMMFATDTPSEPYRYSPTPTPTHNPQHTTPRARETTRPVCSRHPDENHIGPCRPCKRRREWDDAHAAEFAATELGKRRALYEARLSCPKCDPNGMIDTGKGLARCGAHGEAL